MSKWILLLTLVAASVFAQRARVDNMKSFRQDLAAAVSNGSLTAEEKQRYEAALKAIEDQRQTRKSGGQVDRQASRQAMVDLISVARSSNLKEEDRAKLEKHITEARKGKRKN